MAIFQFAMLNYQMVFGMMIPIPRGFLTDVWGMKSNFDKAHQSIEALLMISSGFHGRLKNG
jgi:hypothetical protein